MQCYFTLNFPGEIKVLISQDNLINLNANIAVNSSVKLMWTSLCSIVRIELFIYFIQNVLRICALCFGRYLIIADFCNLNFNFESFPGE